jgi:iron-sulfur cluster assembly protein
MANVVSIENKPSPEAIAAQPHSTVPQAPAQGLQVTEKALKRIRAAMAKEGISPEEGGLRLGVTGGGCSGLSYSIKFIDPKSFLYLHGMTLDYEETLMRQGFNFINPNSTRACSCGSSFSA